MDIESRLSISFYKQIATTSESHNIHIVQHIQTGKIFIRKNLSVYNKSIYEYLKANPIAHTPKIYEVYEEDSLLTVIEEYISGDTLEQMLENKTALSNEKIRDIIIQLCSIIKELHECTPPIIHRDIKPSNLIMTPSGELFLLDFNAAKHYTSEKAEDTVLLGTKGYAAPEQYGFGVSTIQTDIYAIGILLKDLTSSEAYLESRQKNEFSSIINKCTRLDSSQRYKDTSSILRILCKNETNIIPQGNDLSHWTTYLPPGFQKLSPLNMLLSGVGYVFLFWLCLSLESKDSTPAVLIVERFFCLLMFLSIVFCSANYRNVQAHFPPCRTNNIFRRVLAVILLDLLIMSAFMFIMILIVSVLL